MTIEEAAKQFVETIEICLTVLCRDKHQDLFNMAEAEAFLTLKAAITEAENG